MGDLSVWCSCGRKMGPDTLRGRGAFRCGCGAQIQVREKRELDPQCVAQEKSRRCNKEPKTGEPVPLCAYHQRQLLKIQLNGVDAETITADLANHIVAAWYDFNTEGGIDREALVAVARERRAKYAAERDQRIAEWEKRRDDREANSVVYFIAMGEKIKIGTTLNLKKRVQGLSLPESAVLATEPGGPRRERQLHGQFAHLREHGEWFRADPELMAYIESINVESSVTRQ